MCECGKTVNVIAFNLKSGATRSCGCLNKEVLSQITHGACASGKTSPTYKSWDCMVQRCTNPNTPRYDRYGGRGITICDRWKKFESFVADMGDRMPGMTLERIDNDKGYSKENCRWATRADQSLNRSVNIVIELNGRKQTASQWADEIGIDRRIIYGRIKDGWDATKAVITPVAKRLKKRIVQMELF